MNIHTFSTSWNEPGWLYLIAENFQLHFGKTTLYSVICFPNGKASKKLRTNLLLEALTVLVHNNWPAFRIRALAVKSFLIT
jgi:hypothetical protein